MLSNNGLDDFRVHGPGWPAGAVEAKEVAELFSRAKIILGVGTCGYTNDIFTMKLRDFDAPMAGALYLTHRNPDLFPFFEEDKEIFFYETPKEAAEKLAQYITNPEFIADRGRLAAIKARMDHTWDKRICEILQEIGILKSTSHYLFTG